ncbi:MAG TPA: vWA domain-containing protein [Polyangiaceae bacterium]|jgi:Mg-chelatase subunit ChlD|nr:vWA domain-containing protein [Polyangiaceae bacterium]
MLVTLKTSPRFRRALRFGWALGLVAGLAAACGSKSEDGSPKGVTGGGPHGGSGSGASGRAGRGGSGHGVGGSSAGGSVATGGTSASSGENAGGDAGHGGQPLDECASSNQAARLTPANLLFLIDKSGSMNCNPPEGDAAKNARCADFPIKDDPDKPSKWEVASSALGTALDTLAGQPNIRAGLTLFPIADQCGVSAEPAVEIAKLNDAQRSDLEDALGGVSPSGDTPIAGAVILSYQHLSDLIKSHTLVGNTFVVLLTDGAETCKISELSKLLSDDVPNARLFDIRTFVIGAPGSEEARGLLSQIAWEGGTASSSDCDHSGDHADRGDCHFDMTKSEDFAADLNAALLAISRTKVLACEFDVPQNPDGGGVDLNRVNVTFKPGSGKTETIAFDDSASCDDADGWQYNSGRTKIELCGPVCDRVQADPQGEVRIALGCPTIKVK